MNQARLFVHLVEAADGTWELRRGRERAAVFATYAQALAAASLVAQKLAPAAVVVHHVDGSFEVAHLVDG